MIAKDKNGKIEVKQAANSGPAGAAVGLLTGSLIGIFGGPVGVAVGGLTGLLFDVSKSGVDVTFLDDVSKTLTAGKFAVFAEIDETWTTPVDTRLQRFGAIAFRRLRGEVIADQLVREREVLEANIKALNDDLKQAASENRAAIQQDIQRVKKQIKAIQEQAKQGWSRRRLKPRRGSRRFRIRRKPRLGGPRHASKSVSPTLRRTSNNVPRSSARPGR